MVLDTFGEWNTSRPIITDEEMQDPVFIAALQAYIAAVHSKFSGKDDALDRITLEVTIWDQYDEEVARSEPAKPESRVINARG